MKHGSAGSLPDMNIDEETKCYIGFSIFPGIGPMRFKLLIRYFGTARSCMECSVVYA